MFKNIIKYFLITIVFISSLLTCVITIGSACSYCNGTRSASASEVGNDNDDLVDFSDIRLCNILSFPYYTPTSVNNYGLSYIVHSDGTINVSGNATNTDVEEYFFILTKHIDLRDSVNYIFGDYGEGCYLRLDYLDESGVLTSCYSFDGGICWSENYVFDGLYLVLWASDNYKNIDIVVKPYVYEYFDYASSWSPPISIIYDFYYNKGLNQGYLNGYNVGLDVGYNKGYGDGFSTGSAGSSFTSESFFNKVLSILDVKIFGFVSIADIMKIIVSVGLVILSLRLFAGG